MSEEYWLRVRYADVIRERKYCKSVYSLRKSSLFNDFVQERMRPPIETDNTGVYLRNFAFFLGYTLGSLKLPTNETNDRIRRGKIRSYRKPDKLIVSRAAQDMFRRLV